MKESTNKEYKSNAAHLHGFLNKVRVNPTFEDGNTAIDLRVTTYESFKKDGENNRRYTDHDVRFITSDENKVKEYQALQKSLDDYDALRKSGKKDIERPDPHKITIDGHLVVNNYTREDGTKVYTNRIIADEKDVLLDAKRQVIDDKKEPMNSISIAGNIASIKMFDNFAIMSVALHYAVPKGSKGGREVNFVNADGKEVSYTEMTNYVNTRINENRHKEEFAALKNGELEVGDKIAIKGQMHENDYSNEEKKSENYGIVIDIASLSLIRKKSEKQELETETKVETKAETKVKAKEDKKEKKARTRGKSL